MGESEGWKIMAEFRKQDTFTVTMEYLREIVAKQTFRDSPAAALRELIQNAHDACLIRAAREGKDDLAVHITLDPVAKTIKIVDMGIGMTLSDIHEYLTTIGRGTKGTKLAEKYGVEERNSKRLENVIGEFGFGFVAAFIIADEIELKSRFASKDSRGVYCRFSSAEVAYEARETDESIPLGTSLLLHLNRKALSPSLKPSEDLTEGNILSWDTVDAIVRKYCVFLEFPIYVALKGDPIQGSSNQIEVPWKNEVRLDEAVKLFYDSRIGKNRLGQILHSIPLSLSRDRGDGVTLEGILFIENAPATDESAGNVEVFIKRMWVCERQQSLLPAWASFLRGIIVTPDLRPMPGRDSVDRQHDGFDRVRNALHRRLSVAFLSLARENPWGFNQMMARHGSIFRWGLVEENERALKERVDYLDAELLRFVPFARYSRRHMDGKSANLNEVLDVDPKQPLEFKDRKRIVNFVARPIPSDRQIEFRRLLSSGNLEVIVPNDESELGIIHCIDNRFADIIFKNVELELLKRYAGLLEGDKRAPWVSFLKFFETLAAEHHMTGADVGDLKPDYMPAVILNVPVSQSADDDVEKPAEKNRRPQVPPLIPGLPPEVARFYNQTLVINSQNSTMKALLEYKENARLSEVDEALAICLHECYHLALDAAIDALPADMMKHHAELTCRILENYVKMQKERLNDATVTQESREELETVQRERDAYRAMYGEVEEELKTPEVLIKVPSVPEERWCVVVFCDLIGSTGSVVGMDFTERGMVMHEFVKLARQEVARHGGFFDKFTGDGLIALFGVTCQRRVNGDIDAGEIREVSRGALAFSTGISAAVANLNLRADIRSVIQRNPYVVKNLEMRIAISAGSVLFGSFGGRGTAVGIPVIVAARLCSEKEAFSKAQSPILVDEEFQKRCPDGNFDAVEYRFVPRGVGSEERIFRPRSLV